MLFSNENEILNTKNILLLVKHKDEYKENYHLNPLEDHTILTSVVHTSVVQSLLKCYQ